MSEKEMADDLVTDEQNSQIIRKTLVKKLIAFIQHQLFHLNTCN